VKAEPALDRLFWVGQQQLPELQVDNGCGEDPAIFSSCFLFVGFCVHFLSFSIFLSGRPESGAPGGLFEVEKPENHFL